MQRVTLVRYAVKPEHVAENERLSRAVFETLREEAPEQLTYSLYKNGHEFVHLFVNLGSDESAVITELPAFKAYQKDLSTRYEAPPEVTRLSVELIDSYGLPVAARVD
jgi:quinol monooxygenase YgiN